MMQTRTILKTLKKEYPAVRTALDFSNPLQILIATILSAQCTDKRVNIVTKDLFKKYRTVKDFAGADQKTFEREIRSTGFYKQKSRNILLAAKRIVTEYNGKVPRLMEELVTLPGVGRKTANIVQNAGYGVVSGIAVDTHVKRLSSLLGLTDNTDPVKIERDLMRIIPRMEWGKVNYLLVAHGRKVCGAKRPDCPVCTLKKMCPSFGKFK